MIYRHQIFSETISASQSFYKYSDMWTTHNLAYAELALDFDSLKFISEYDQHILPEQQQFVQVHKQWRWMPLLNPVWQIISDQEFAHCDRSVAAGETSFGSMTHYWQAVNLMRLESGEHGLGAEWRSLNFSRPLEVKERFRDLAIVDWIQQNIPAKKIVGIHCVSILPNNFATPHRDAAWANDSQPNPAMNNGFFRSGHVVTCLNLSDGGSPLLWAMDHEKNSPRSTNAKCYISNDYFVHGVPRVSSLRRQIRISYVPKDDLMDLLVPGSVVTIPDDYVFD